MQQDQAKNREPRLSDYLDAEEIRALTEVPLLRPAFDIAMTWLWILGSLALFAYYPSVPLFILCFVLIASRQLAMTHLVHDASHYRLFPSRWWNEWLSDLLAAGPVLISTESYRVQHLPHHQFLGDHVRDSDRRTWYNIKGFQFLRRSLLTLLGWEALQTFGSYAQASQGGDSGEAVKSGGDLPRRLLCAALGNGLILAWCTWLGDPWLYLWLWFVPMFTLTMYLLILRVLVEHQPLDYARRGVDRPEEDMQPILVRTVTPGPLGQFLLGPMNFHYHHEHHLAPAVPYANLPRLHRRLLELNYFQDHPEALEASYFSTLKQLVFPGSEQVPHG